MVFRIAYSYVKCVHDADDVTQDVFLKLYRVLSESETVFVADVNVKAWLIRVTINASKSLLKSNWRTRRADLPDSAATQSMTGDCLELHEYINELKPKYRTIIYLYYYERYSVKEIAGILKIRQTTVTTQLGRARNQLKEILLTEGFA